MPGKPLNRVSLVYSDEYLISLGGLEKLHPFDIRKYERIVERLEADGYVQATDYFLPSAVPDSTMGLVHTPEYLTTLNDGAAIARYLEAPVLSALPTSMLKKNVVGAFRHATGGTILAARQALQTGIGINIGGGYHHAKPAIGEGFNIFNDMAVAIRVLQQEGEIRRALVVDLDVHQGNGTALCFQGDPDVFTFSIHQEAIYPQPKERSDLDIGLPAGVTDSEYANVLAQHWPSVLDKATPDIVFYQAGCDVLDGDPLASLAMSHDGVAERDRTVIDQCVERGIPVVMLLGGGYSDDAWRAQYQSIRSILEAHDEGSPRYAQRKPRKMARN